MKVWQSRPRHMTEQNLLSSQIYEVIFQQHTVCPRMSYVIHILGDNFPFIKYSDKSPLEITDQWVYVELLPAFSKLIKSLDTIFFIKQKQFVWQTSIPPPIQLIALCYLNSSSDPRSLLVLVLLSLVACLLAMLACSRLSGPPGLIVLSLVCPTASLFTTHASMVYLGACSELFVGSLALYLIYILHVIFSIL